MIKKPAILIFAVTALFLTLLFTGCKITRRPGVELIFTLKADGTYSVSAAEGFNAETLTIPENLTVINVYCFNNCPSLAHIYYKGTRKQWDQLKRGAGLMGNAPDITLHCSDAVFEDFNEWISWYG